MTIRTGAASTITSILNQYKDTYLEPTCGASSSVQNVAILFASLFPKMYPVHSSHRRMCYEYSIKNRRRRR